MKRLQYLLQSKYANIAFILIAIAGRIIFTTLYSTIGRDTKVQVTYAENLLAGKGMGVTKYFTTDLDHAVFDTYQLFPPGFSFAITPFLKLFGGNEYNAVLAFDIVAAILFIISVRILVKNIGLPSWLNNIVTLIAGCVQYPFFMSYSSTDVISVSLVLFALSAMIRIVDKKKSLSLIQIGLYGFLFFLPSFFRYMYLPITILLPLLVIYYGFLKENKQLKNTGIRLMISAGFFLIVLFGLMAFFSGNAIHIYNTGRGFFPGQLIHWYPFLPASFINLDFAAQLIANVAGIHYSQVIFLFEIINTVFFVGLVALFVHYLINNKKIQSVSRHFNFIITGSVISLTIILMLSYLSFTYKAQDWGNYKWTYNYDVRYFGFIYVFTLLLFFTVFYNYSSIFKRVLTRLLAFVIIFCLFIEVLHGFYYNAKIVMQHEDLAFIKNGDMSYRKFPAILKDFKKQYPDRQIFVCSPDQFYLQTAEQMECKAIFDYVNLNKTEIRSSAKSILLLAVHKEDEPIMTEYIQRYNPRILSTVAETDFYIKEIDPQ